jgi:hypothetical protein
MIYILFSNTPYEGAATIKVASRERTTNGIPGNGIPEIF